MTFVLFTVVTLLSFFGANSHIWKKWLNKWLKSPSAEEQVLRSEKQQLQKDQSQYNMMDNFAKYSKIQRKINAIDEQLKSTKENKHSLSRNLMLTYAINAVCPLVLLLLTIYYRRTPLFKLPDFLDLMPFDYIISYPNERNHVSFHFWVMSCNVVARSFKF